jgi:hypothetical protein
MNLTNPGIGQIIAIVVLVVCVVAGLLHLLPALLAVLIGALAIARLT